jgi:hypothetical protein
MSNPWFRHYCGMMRDEKLVGVAVRSKQPVERVIWVWGAILESASEIGNNGQYEFDCAEAAYFLRADESDLLSIIDGLAAAGRIKSGLVAKWGDRQYISDKSVSRQAAFRERKKKNICQDFDSTENSDVTTPSPQRHVTAQDTDTDTDTDTDKKDLLAKARVRGQFDIFWSVYPVRLAKGAAEKAWKAAIKKHMPDKIIESARIFAAQQFGKDQQYIAHPATWLNQERWNDEPQLTVQTQVLGPNNAKPTQNSKSRFTSAANELRESLGLGEDHESPRYDSQAGP